MPLPRRAVAPPGGTLDSRGGAGGA